MGPVGNGTWYVAGMPKRTMIVAFVLLAICWAGSWLLSHTIWYGVGETHDIPHRLKENVEGVEVLVWANPTEDDWSRTWWFPLMIRHHHRGPFIVGIRLVDPRGSAKGVTVHSAALRRADGSMIALRLVDDESKPAEEWWPFYSNASQHIVDIHHQDPIHIEAPADLELDISLDVSGRTVRRHLSLRVEIEVCRSAGWGFAT